MNVLEMFTQPCFPVELLAAQVTSQSILAVVVEHVGFQLRVLNKILAADLALVISAPSVSSNVSVERFLCCESILAHWALVRTLTGMDASKI